MKIIRAEERAAQVPNPEYFTGEVRMQPVWTDAMSERARALNVSFQPGARTAWHTHPLGQTLLVVSGIGRAQREGGPVEVIRPGDVIWFAPGERHWHGAAPDQAMTHIAMHEADETSSNVTWAEKLSDAEYSG